MSTNPFVLPPAEPLRQIEQYTFQIGDKHYSLRFLPMLFFEGYTDTQLERLSRCAVYEVSFALQDFTLADGSMVAGYGTTNTGDSFKVLGGVAHGLIDWARERRPDYLLWSAHSVRRQRLYDRMIHYFAVRGSGWYRLEADPFTQTPSSPGTFWLQRNI